jgi:hypothetical protein
MHLLLGLGRFDPPWIWKIEGFHRLKSDYIFERLSATQGRTTDTSVVKYPQVHWLLIRFFECSYDLETCLSLGVSFGFPFARSRDREIY